MLWVGGSESFDADLKAVMSTEQIETLQGTKSRFFGRPARTRITTMSYTSS
jgi:hypothetical protein